VFTELLVTKHYIKCRFN